jgi:DUF971 family protein
VAISVTAIESESFIRAPRRSAAKPQDRSHRAVIRRLQGEHGNRRSGYHSVVRPTLIQQIGQELVVVWDDAHESYYPLEQLRRDCPCAICAGESDLFGRIARGPAPTYRDSSFDLLSWEPTGNYGIQLNFADGHNWGIWAFDRLRAFCRCDACVAVRA